MTPTDAATAERLAREGGEPVRAEPLSFAPPALGAEERANVLRSLETGWLTSGPFVAELEREFAAYVGAPHAFAASSCTTAMHLALVSLGIGEGDEVVTTPFTWPATANTIVQAGATPVFADVDPDTLCLDPAAAAAAVTVRTRAVMPVHYAGQACDMDALGELCAERGLRLVEDAAHAVETRAADGRKVGAIGDVTCFSFYANKNLAAGEGGMLTLADDQLAERIRSLRVHGLDRDAWRRYEKAGPGAYDVIAPGYKYNLSDLHAGVALAQLHRLDEHHARREAQAARYDEGLAGLAGITPLRPRGDEGSLHARHLYVIRVEQGAFAVDRDVFAAALQAEGIGTGMHFLAVHELTYYRERFPGLRLPVAERAAREVVSLPLSPAHDLADVDDVVHAVRKVHARYHRG
jgi:dTDP-4-amino-4,6-dideoxygalactose transaminase